MLYLIQSRDFRGLENKENWEKSQNLVESGKVRERGQGIFIVMDICPCISQSSTELYGLEKISVNSFCFLQKFCGEESGKVR